MLEWAVTIPSVRKMHAFAATVVMLLVIAIAIYRAQQSPARITPLPTLTPSPVVLAAQTSSPSAQLYPVIKVVDGDTISVEINGKKETIRFIGMDTPEIVDPRKPVQCFAREASAKMHELIDGTSVSLVADPTQGDRDKYRRLLRYVYTKDGVLLNQLMIEQGYAHEYTYDKPYKFQEEFRQAEHDAIVNKRGLWADPACPVPTPSGKK